MSHLRTIRRECRNGGKLQVTYTKDEHIIYLDAIKEPEGGDIELSLQDAIVLAKMLLHAVATVTNLKRAIKHNALALARKRR
jgi:hypothetical protein